ncbi:MAG: HEAT repeat domain-containing protein [Deltaproteobacteria bacterium]|nr:HEAT repeat domain-containing protein [Deltaproteobacteria bacterium]
MASWPARGLLLLLGLSGCASLGGEVRRAVRQGDVPGALERYRAWRQERGEGDPDVLAEVALGLLANAAASAEAPRRASGFSALRSLGVRGRDTLEALSERRGVVAERALVALWELDGRSGALPARLGRLLSAEEPERRALGAAWLGSRRDSAGLLRLVEDPDETVRSAAVRELSRGGHSAARDALLALARRDPSASVRAAAVVALGGLGPEAGPALTEALSDPDRLVRMMAPASLAAAAPSEAEAVLGPFLTPEPGELSLEAARALASRHVARAEDYLLASLSSPRAGVRAQAAVAVSMLARDRARELARHLEHPDPEVSLRIAALLVRRPELRAGALSTLRGLAARPDGFVAIRALAALAAEGQEHTLEPVTEALGAREAAVRRLAVLAWPDVTGPSGDVDPLAPLLLDPDPSVALLAAVEIVLIAAR